MRDPAGPLSGRRREAARNDTVILDAARAVFLNDPSAPISGVAARANVGMSALYRRYPSKDDLLRELARDGLVTYIGELEAAWQDDRDPWTVYAECLGRVLDGGSQALAQRLAGTFTPTPDLVELAQRAAKLAEQVHQRAQVAHAVRVDVNMSDVVFLLEALSAISLPGPDGGQALRRRYLALILQALRAEGAAPLPGRPADPRDSAARWRPQAEQTHETSVTRRRSAGAAPAKAESGAVHASGGRTRRRRPR